MQVEQLMSRPVLTCSPNDTLQGAAQLMWEQEKGSVVIVQAGKIVGLLTDRDIAMGAYTSGQALWEVPISRSMTPVPVTIAPEATIDAAEKAMRDHKVRRLPVVDAKGTLVGVISLDDVAREAQRQYGRKQVDVTPDGVAATLAAVAEPRRPVAIATVPQRKQ